MMTKITEPRPWDEEDSMNLLALLRLILGGTADMDSGDDARDRGLINDPAYECDKEPGLHW